ncbi:uncharacterized protein [Apostichopus japonicus]|uniref:uncharacterized protein isoform X2 n=1 Tax=Stichopus japonicus TaxID=307972 RepID=UPI003AB49905
MVRTKLLDKRKEHYTWEEHYQCHIFKKIFICEGETTAHIAEALSIIKEWNLRWKPRFFMIDYSETEYQTLQDVFPEAHKYVCSFHREQAWIRWCREEKKNQLTTDNQHHLLKMLRDIATANSEEKCDKGIHILRSSKLYASNNRLKAYTETRRLGICQTHPPKRGYISKQQAVVTNPVVMNAYLSVLRSQCNTSDTNHVFIIPSYLAVLWDAGRFNTWMMREINLVMFKWIFMPINITNNHWILLAANVPQMSVSILDSMDTGKGLSYIGKWKKVMHNRSMLVGELDGEWKTGHLMSAQQKDGNSCGSFVLMNALALTRTSF